MADILIVFGSKSDSNVFCKIAEELAAKKISYELRAISAHRTPELLMACMEKTKAKIIIAGAGLAAHLPGVVASKTIKPVIGVPVNSNFDGLDSLLSIVQMPPGIPVLSVGIDNAVESAGMAALMLKEYNEVNIVANEELKDNKRVKKCKETLAEFNVKHTTSNNFDNKKININFIDFNENSQKFDSNLVINIPVKDTVTKSSAVHFAELTKTGLWVGINRGENAAIAAVEILNVNGKFEKKLVKYREEMKQKVIKDDASLR